MSGKEHIATIGLIDSGADLSAMSKDFADLLGLDLSGKKSPSYGVGGEVKSVESSMSLTLEKGHEKYTFRIPVNVILGDFDFPVLLGRKGFFDKFVISFDQNREKVSLKRVIRR